MNDYKCAFLRITIAFMALWAGCGENKSTQDTKTKDAITYAEDAITYTIVKESAIPNLKRSLVVRLNKRISKDALTTIALKLKEDSPDNYDRTFIFYYLPGMEIGKGAWAATDFNPNLEVRILGLSQDEELTLNSQKIGEGKLIGAWIWEPGFNVRIAILQRGQKTFLETTGKYGSSGIQELTVKQTPSGTRYEYMQPIPFGGYYLLEMDGRLGIYDNDGLTTKLMPIK
jgi:hypothetical protein